MVRLTITHTCCCVFFVTLCLALVSGPNSAAAATRASSPLLLSLDVERDSDVAALKKLNLTVPATYFVTGEFASKYPEQVRALAGKGTIGSHSHSHPNLTNLEIGAVKEDLLNSMRAIESATGKSPIWFRAPFLELNDEVLAVAREIGFVYDSSETERWVKQGILSELPISINTTGRILFSDYDIFSVYGVEDRMALDMLQENYLSRLETGRPFIFLLHPSMIVEHADVLHQFIDFVHEQGGSCLSFDQYLKRTFKDSAVDVGIRIDPTVKGLSAQQVVKDLQELNITDAFILARDRSGKNFYSADPTWDGPVEKTFRDLVHGLYQAGIRVYAELPVLMNEYAIKEYPDLAMVDGGGSASKKWISPSHPHTLSNLDQYVSELLEELPLQGIHLDAVKYPEMHADFSPMAVKQFQQDTGVGVPIDKAASLLPGNHYSEWISWRFEQIGNVIQVAANAASKKRRDVVISASLDSDSLINFEVMESSGQNYSLLARYLDMIATVPDYSITPSVPSLVKRVLHISRTMVGEKKLFIGMPREISDITPTRVYDLSKMIRGGAEGIVFPSYHHLLETQEGKSSANINELKLVIDWFLSPVTDSISLSEEESSIFVEQVKASLSTTENSPTEIAGTRNQNKQGWSLKVLPLSAFAIFVALTSFLLYKKIKRDSRENQQQTSTPLTPFDSKNITENVQADKLTGPMVHSVALFLRRFDPVNTSRFRTGYILNLAAESEEVLTVQEILKVTADIPGWQVLAMSYIKEAIMHNYVRIDHDRLIITPKGLQELESLKAEGFDSNQWLFIEERLHEVLHVPCPHCNYENSTHWYWTSFTCRKCNREVELRNCSDIYCRNIAGIELNQFNII